MIFLTLLICSAWSARANEPNSSNRDLARDHFGRGAELFANEAYKEALEAFTRSYELHPNGVALFNTAMCHLALSSNVEAILTFRRFLQSADPARDTELVEEAKHSIAKLLPLVARLKLEGVSQAAVVEINGFPLVAGSNGEYLVQPGQSAIRVNAEGYEPYEKTINVSAGSSTVLQVVLAKVAPAVPEEPEEIDTQPLLEEPLATPRAEKETRVVAATADTRPGTQNKEKSRVFSPLLMSSLCSAGLGLVAMGVGGYYSYLQSSNIKSLENLNNRYLLDETMSNDSYLAERKLMKSELRKDHIGLAVGYTIGGALIVTGAILFGIDYAKKSRGGEKSFAFVPTPNGVAMRF